MMAVGVCRVQLLIAESASLKDKRQVVRSAVQRMRQRFNVSVAEIEDLDSWSQATLAIVCVSNEAPHAHGLLSRAIEWLAQERLDADIGEVSIEVW
jgi:uncharacterized protein